MGWEQIVPSVVAIIIAIVSPIIAAWANRRRNQAGMRDDQSSAFSRYWARITELEQENSSLKRKIEGLEMDNRKLNAEIGNLYLQLSKIRPMNKE